VLGDRRAGVGVESMRHRAEELGGGFEAGPGSSGWVVAARLPAPGLAAVTQHLPV
jgi:two-component system NarL family sensor kinase